MSWSRYYFQSDEHCMDEDSNKRIFLMNIKKLVSIHEFPVAFENYKINVNNTHTNNTDVATNKNINENSSIRDGVILNVEGLHNKDYESSTDIFENVQHPRFAKCDIVNNRKTSWNDIKSANGCRKVMNKISTLENKTTKGIKEKYKHLYKNVYFILMLASLALISFGNSIIFTHLLPFAESENLSSSIGLLMVSVLGGAGLIGRIALGAFAQLPWVNAVVLYIAAFILCGIYSWFYQNKSKCYRF